MKEKFLTAKEAAELLNISLPTLYAYVSRQLIRSEEADSKRRTRKYYREDVERLLNKKELRKNPSKAAETALNWGQPILESAITRIENGRFYYRGHDACQLAKTAPFEAICQLLWQGDMAQPISYPDVEILEEWRGFLAQQSNLRQIEQFQMLLPLVAAHDWACYDLSATAVAKTSSKILAFMLGLVADQPLHAAYQSAATVLQQAWAPTLSEVEHLINMSLILCADHELNVSAFTARAVASAKSTPYAAVNAGLSALKGVLHGGHTERVQALLREAGTASNARQTVASRLRRGEPIPGFGHLLYPDGDPRAVSLLNEIRNYFPGSEAVVLADGVITAVYEAIGYHPNIDFGLVVLGLVAGFPEDAPLALFAIGRTAGWLGHIIEQYQQNQLIRPRAKYIGE